MSAQAQRRMLLSLAKNDFRKKFAGSYLGAFWALVQPVVTVLVYWFVFQVGLRQTHGPDGAPFLLWMLAGLVPWFYFQDAWTGETSALVEYSYLVKKVVFRVEILPLIKAVSALFVHLFFTLLALVLCVAYGYFPGRYLIQLPYYMAALFLLVLGLGYLTAAVAVLFRDLVQLVNIALQVGVWATPIMWNLADIGLPRPLVILFKLNPLYYIVTGWRDTLLSRTWFWERPALTLYYWVFTAAVLWLGIRVFGRLRDHFSDVL